MKKAKLILSLILVVAILLPITASASVPHRIYVTKSEYYYNTNVDNVPKSVALVL